MVHDLHKYRDTSLFVNKTETKLGTFYTVFSIVQNIPELPENTCNTSDRYCFLQDSFILHFIKIARYLVRRQIVLVELH